MKGGDIPMYQAMYKGIVEGNPVNMGEVLANATMTGIFGRNAAYTGRGLTWNWIMNGSKEDLTPEHALSFDAPFPADPPPVPGVSPTTYLRRCRLHGAHGALRRAAPEVGEVKRAALDWGFWHFGRFARDYRQLFGESPSETLVGDR